MFSCNVWLSQALEWPWFDIWHDLTKSNCFLDEPWWAWGFFVTLFVVGYGSFRYYASTSECLQCRFHDSLPSPLCRGEKMLRFFWDLDHCKIVSIRETSRNRCTKHTSLTAIYSLFKRFNVIFNAAICRRRWKPHEFPMPTCASVSECLRMSQQNVSAWAA